MTEEEGMMASILGSPDSEEDDVADLLYSDDTVEGEAAEVLRDAESEAEEITEALEASGLGEEYVEGIEETPEYTAIRPEDKSTVQAIRQVRNPEVPGANTGAKPAEAVKAEENDLGSLIVGGLIILLLI